MLLFLVIPSEKRYTKYWIKRKQRKNSDIVDNHADKIIKLKK